MEKVTPKQVVEKHRKDILKIKGVSAIAFGMSSTDSSKRCIIVYADLDQWPDQLPHELDGYQVEVQKTSGFNIF